MGLTDLVTRLAKRAKSRTEADIQADIKQLLVEAPFNLGDDDLDLDPEWIRMESQVGDGRRIDVEVGSVIIEVKRSLGNGMKLAKAEDQLKGYVEYRQSTSEVRYVGVLTDGRAWRCYHLGPDGLELASKFELRPSNLEVERLVVWLEGVLATAQQIPPSPKEIQTRLGANSSAHSLDRASLTDLYERHRNLPGVKMKRLLWSKLLSTALGTNFKDDDKLFVEHTILVNSAEIIAHAVVGFDVTDIPPKELLAGERFGKVQIFGVVEEDFFDWPAEVPGGDVFVTTLARRLSRFDWSAVEHDVLKELYESVIGQKTRKELGEYYTPDWLAGAMVEKVVTTPLEQRVLDPACGSGTFLFQGVRRYLAAAEAAGQETAHSIAEVVKKVVGIDLHPVAVAFARVTYLLAIGRERLQHRKGALRIPVYLGDSMQWQRKPDDLWTAGYLAVDVKDGQEMFLDLRFPYRLLDEADKFDELVNEMIRRATNRKPAYKPDMTATFERLGVRPNEVPVVSATFKTLCRLHDEGRDHIWGYYIRNLARPAWLSRPENRFDVLVGNPPWLAYKYMPPHFETDFRNLSHTMGLWSGGSSISQHDLAGLFVARCVQLYLSHGGCFGFVMPSSALDRPHHKGFRNGVYHVESESVRVCFSEAWDLRRVRPHFFPITASVVFGVRTNRASSLPDEVSVWRLRVPKDATSWATVKRHLEIETSDRTSLGKPQSPYHEKSRNGATIYPRVLFVVKEDGSNVMGNLGLPGGTAAVVSRSSWHKPWKYVEQIQGILEDRFIKSAHFGTTLLPYRMLQPEKAVIPLDGDALLDSANSKIEDYRGLQEWMVQAESLWELHKSEKKTLIEKLDDSSKLTSQLPIRKLRVVHNKSGKHIVASRLTDGSSFIDNTLYWIEPSCEDESYYLCAVLNAYRTTLLVRPYMSYGKDERDIHKHIWQVSIPEFDDSNPLHKELVSLGKRAEAEVAAADLDLSKSCTTLRNKIRKQLTASAVGQQIEECVKQLIG